MAELESEQSCGHSCIPLRAPLIVRRVINESGVNSSYQDEIVLFYLPDVSTLVGFDNNGREFHPVLYSFDVSFIDKVQGGKIGSDPNKTHILFGAVQRQYLGREVIATVSDQPTPRLIGDQVCYPPKLNTDGYCQLWVSVDPPVDPPLVA